MRKELLAGVLVLLVAPLFAVSYFPARLDDPKAVYLTAENFRVKADGVADDTAALQSAINTVEEKSRQGIVFIPSGRYRVTKTVYIWPGIRLIGYGITRPAFLLAANTPGIASRRVRSS